jgi:hypothetical protein
MPGITLVIAVFVMLLSGSVSGQTVQDGEQPQIPIPTPIPHLSTKANSWHYKCDVTKGVCSVDCTGFTATGVAELYVIQGTVIVAGQEIPTLTFLGQASISSKWTPISGFIQSTNTAIACRFIGLNLVTPQDIGAAPPELRR